MNATKDVIRIIGARTNNLKNVHVDIPKNQLIVVTGLSGSGKSSLAIDTLFAEGQRQYIESLSLYARQFFQQNSATDVETIEGLQPTVCIDQKRGPKNPRSTVGTITEIHDFLRLLFAKTGVITCPICGQRLAPQTIDQVVRRVLTLPERSKIIILAPMVSERKGQHQDVFANIRNERLVRVRIDGELFDIDRLPELDAKQIHSIEAVADRIIVKEGIENRLLESLELANKLSGGTIIVSYQPSGVDGWTDLCFSTRNACSKCGEGSPAISTRTFSFNSPSGACDGCDGLGIVETFSPLRVVPNRKLPIAEAVVPWRLLGKSAKQKQVSALHPLMEQLNVAIDAPLDSFNDSAWDKLLFGDDKRSPGILVLLEKEFATSTNEQRLDQLETFRGRIACSKCNGSRLNRIANAVMISGGSISDVCNLPIAEISDWVNNLQFEGEHNRIAEPILENIGSRVRFLEKVGLGYLTLARSADSLSGGELQRVRLCKSIGNGLTGACYILDEPSIGLHAHDNEKLIETMLRLKDRSNTLVVVEHDDAIMRSADQIIDVGPGAGIGGGNIVFQGTFGAIVDAQESVTGDYLAKRKIIGKDRESRKPDARNRITLKNASGFNLKNLDLEIPLDRFCCVSGVSGSGKSTLIYRTLAPAIKFELGLVAEEPAPFESIEGVERIDRLVEVDQRPISRTPRGCAATYTGIFDDIRKIFASTKMAKQLGFSAARFSFNSKQGWCTTCEGHGVQRMKMKFMPDVVVSCASCKGKRFNRQTLSVQFAGMTIADVLELSVEEAGDAFANFSRIAARLECLQQVGLGYLALGQPSTSLSGGEAQRIKLASELSNRVGNTLYLMDEPTTGLHFQDIERLIQVISRLVKDNNTVVVIEHNLDVISCADWVIDLGPGAGEAGGNIVAACPPQELGNIQASLTGRCLASR